MNIDQTILQKYAPTIASALVLLVPAVDILAKNPSPIAVLQFLALLVTTATTFALTAPWKQVVEWVGVVVAAVLPLAITGDITWANWAFVVVAVVKALAAHFGVVVRQDATIDARETPADQVPTITAVPLATVVPVESIPEGSNLTAGDGLGGVTITSAEAAEAARVELGEQSTPEHREP